MNELDNYIEFKNLKNKMEVKHLFTKKPFDFKKTKEDINLQYMEIQKILNYSCEKIIKPIQTHTNIVKKIDNSNLNNKFENVDGLITNLKGVALAISLADCQGIFLYDTKKKVIGNIHSGWQGTLNRIIQNAILLMKEEYSSNTEDIEVYIGPSILKCCFEVDEEVKEMFIQKFKDIGINNFILKGKIKENRQKYFVDTVGINVEVAKNMGVLKKNIFISNICTKCNKDKFHSHRGESGNAGRNLGFIVLT